MRKFEAPSYIPSTVHLGAKREAVLNVDKVKEAATAW